MLVYTQFFKEKEKKEGREEILKGTFSSATPPLCSFKLTVVVNVDMNEDKNEK